MQGPRQEAGEAPGHHQRVGRFGSNFLPTQSNFAPRPNSSLRRLFGLRRQAPLRYCSNPILGI